MLVWSVAVVGFAHSALAGVAVVGSAHSASAGLEVVVGLARTASVESAAVVVGFAHRRGRVRVLRCLSDKGLRRRRRCSAWRCLVRHLPGCCEGASIGPVRGHLDHRSPVHRRPDPR